VRGRALIPIVAALAISCKCARPASAWTALVNGSRPGINRGGLTASDALGNFYVAGSLTTANGSSPAVGADPLCCHRDCALGHRAALVRELRVLPARRLVGRLPGLREQPLGRLV